MSSFFPPEQGTLPNLFDFIIKDETPFEDVDKSFKSISSESKSIINEDINLANKFAINSSKNIQDSNNQKQVTRSRGSIHKIMIPYQDCSEIKRKIIKEVQQIRLKSLKKHNTIEFNLFLNEEAKTKQRKSKITKKKFHGSHKNLPKILGSGIISFSIKQINSQLIQQFIAKRSCFLDELYKDEVKNQFFSLKDFHIWIKTENLKKTFVNLRTFRDIWGFKLPESDAIGFRHHFYCCVLRRISKYYMKNEFFRLVFKKVISGSIQKENAICYLNKISVFLKGLKHPQNLLSIKEMNV